jgi:hypothetical protein
MESTLLEAIQKEEVMKEHWDCKLMFKEEVDGPEIDLLNFVNLSEEKEDKNPKKQLISELCLKKSPYGFNGLADLPKLQKELHSSGISGGYSLISNDVKTLSCGKK